MIKYTADELIKDTKNLAKKIKEFAPDVILPIARGGLTFAHLLSEELEIRDVRCINSIGYHDKDMLDDITVFNIPKIENKKVLIVDDIADSGKTLQKVVRLLKEKNPTCSFKTVTIFYKEDSVFQPDFKVRQTDEWVEFFWNKSKL